MIASPVLQKTIDGIKEIAGVDIALLGPGGAALACTSTFDTGGSHTIKGFVSSADQSQSLQGNQYIKVYNEDAVLYVLVLRGEAPELCQTGRLAAFNIQSLVQAYKKRNDKKDFIKNLLLDNILPVDINNLAKKLQVETNIKRVVYLIETDPGSHQSREQNAIEVVRSLFPAKQRDFVTSVDEHSLLLIKDLRDHPTQAAILQYAKDICDTLAAESMCKAHVYIGNTAADLKALPASYREAKTARDVGKIFEASRQIVNYNQLGLGRLIYQMPVSLCKLFLSEVLGGKAAVSFDEEALNTVHRFFDNDLNVSETSRDLYIHRNTLVYRLDRLQKQTGLDLRRFDDAITFKIALMVGKYVNHKERPL